LKIENLKFLPICRRNKTIFVAFCLPN